MRTHHRTLNEHPLIGRRGRSWAFFWGAAEASFFFLIPDILLTWVAMKAPRRAVWHWVLAVLGAVLMGWVMYSWAARSSTAQSWVAAVPRVSANMFEQAAQDLRRHGAWGTAHGPARGIPYKIYAVLAPSNGVPAAEFVAVSVPARAWRMALLMLGFALLGMALRRWSVERWGTPIHVVFWVISVAFYWTQIG